MRQGIGSVVGSAVLGLVGAAAAWISGVSLLQSVLIAVSVIVAGAAKGFVEKQRIARADEQWGGDWTLTRKGCRRDVRELGWRMRGYRGRVHGDALQRLQRVAHTRLLRHGVDLDEPARLGAAEALLGPTAHRVLTAESGRPVRYAAFVHAVDALERLNVPEPARTSANPLPTPTSDPR